MIRRYWIVALVSVLLLVGFISTLLTSYFVAYKSLGEEISRITLPLTSDNVYTEIQKDLVRSIHISSQMAHDTFLKDWVLQGENEPTSMVRYLAAIQNKYRTVTAFFVSENTRRYYHPDGVIKTVSKEDLQDAWYFRARSMEKPYEINVDTDTADRSRITIFINHQVHGYDNRMLGITGVGLELKQVQDILASYKERYGSDVFFVDKKGMVVLRPSDFPFPENLNDWKGFSSPLTGILSGQAISFEHRMEDGAYFFSSRHIPELDLTLVIMRSSDALNQPLRDRLKSNSFIGFVITVVVVAIMAMVLRRYNQNLERLINMDPLTGAYNRGSFSAIFQHAVKDSKRRNTSLSLVLTDIDNFKSINDRFGHHRGDLVLKDFALEASQLIRESDVICRWGGEEFVILLRDCEIKEAAGVADKIRKEISNKTKHDNAGDLRYTFSAGVAQYEQGESLAQLVARADKLMYEAKEHGKDRIVSQGLST
jgi:diguanylate cyclase (GGDEF)-like protein